MNFEKVKEELVTEVETYLAKKKYTIDKLQGVEKLKAKYQHLEELNVFSEMLTSRINAIVENNNIVFQNDTEFNKFNTSIKPTIDDLYKMFYAVGHENLK